MSFDEFFWQVYYKKIREMTPTQVQMDLEPRLGVIWRIFLTSFLKKIREMTPTYVGPNGFRT